MEEFRLWLAQPVDAAPLCLFRFLFGMTIFIFKSRRIRSIYVYYTTSPFYFYYELTPFIRPMGKMGMALVLGLNLASLFCFAIGFHYQISAIAACTTYTYLFLCDKSCFVNHFYLTALFLFLFCFVEGNKMLAVDAYRAGDGETIPYWNSLIFQLQMAIVYTYAGLNKINAEWLVRGESLRSAFRGFEGQTGFSFHRYCFSEGVASGVKRFFLSDKVVMFACWYAMFLDTTIIWLLFIPGTHPLSVPLFLSFNLFNHWFFAIGTFPYMNYAALLLFLNPEVSRMIIDWMRWV